MNKLCMIRRITVAILFCIALTMGLCGCDSTSYIVSGATYQNGIITTPDGNVWKYQTDEDGRPHKVTVKFDNNGTPEVLEDDIVMDIAFW